MRALASHRCGLGLNLGDCAIPRLVLCSPQREYFPIPIRWAILNQERVCRGCTTTKSVCLLVYLFNLYFLPFGFSFDPYVRSTFVPPSTYLLGGYSKLPWIVGAFHSPKICVKFWKFPVSLSGTVHTGCTDVTETTERLIRAKYNTRAKIKQKSPEKRPTH